MNTRWNGKLFILCICLSLLPVAWFMYLPITDGPTHVYNARLLLDYYVTASPLAREYYQPNPAPVPNWLAHIVLAAAMTVLSPAGAERVLIAGYVLLLPLALRYALRSVTAQPTGLEFLIFPVLFNSHLHWGFYGFCYSLGFCLLAVAVWIRHSQVMNVKKCLVLAGLLLLAYFSNPIGWLESVIALCVLAASGALRRGGRPSVISRLFGQSAWIIAAVSPSAILYLLFLAGRVETGRNLLEWPSLRYAASNLFKLTPLSTFFPAEQYLAAGLAVFLASAVVLFGLRAFRRDLSGLNYLILAITGGLLVFVAPVSATGGTMITPRLVYFPLFALLLWLASQPAGRPWRIIFAAAGVIAGLGLGALHWPVYVRYDRLMTAFVSEAGRSAGGSTMIFVTFRNKYAHSLDPGSQEVNPSGSAGAYVAASQGLVYLNNYEAQTDHFPFLFQSSRDPANYALYSTEAVQCPVSDGYIDLARYEAGTGRAVDYVVLWAPAIAAGNDACRQKLIAQVLAQHEAIGTGGKPNYLSLYRRRPE